MLLDEPKIRRWTKSEYYQAVALGWFEGQRVELINGRVVKMAPQLDKHAFAVTLADYAVRHVFGDGYVVRVQLPMDFGNSQPEPDVAVVQGALRTVQKHPTTAALVVEVAYATLAYDRGRKGRLYASRGIVDYWIVNLIDQQLEVYRRPARDGQSPFRHGYTETKILRAGENLSPLALPKTKIKVDDLLP